MENKQTLKGDALVNKVVLIVIEIINCALIFGYISDYLTGTAPLSYFVVFEIAAIITFFAIPIAYKKAPDKMRYIALGCFAVVYCIGCMGANIDVAFVMGFPITIVFILYYDYKLIKIVSTIFASVVTADIVYVIFIKKELHSGMPLNSSVLLMEFLGTTIFFVALTVVTGISNQNNKDKMDQIREVADRVNASITGINSQIAELDRSAQVVKGAMGEINQGMDNVVEAVTEQTLQTEEIQSRVENVGTAAQNISQNVSDTLVAVDGGNREVLELLKRTEDSVVIGNRVTDDLGALSERIRSMGTITKMIENIAFQTNIMALNANVEAARAGDAGAGFAVVASEISNMAAQTKEATDKIEDMIKNAQDSLAELVDSVEELSDIINAQKNQSALTKKAFESIEASTREVESQIDNFMEYIGGLNQANSRIVTSVQTISAASEEVSALTQEAVSMENNNADAVQNIARQVGELAG